MNATMIFGVLAAAAFTLISSLSAVRAMTPEEAREEQAYAIGLQAYIYGYPMTVMYRLRHERVFDPANQERVPLNHFYHFRK